MSNFNLTMKQAVDNAATLHLTGVIFTTDNSGNLGYISKYNLLGRIVNFIRNLIEGSTEHKVNKAILATFETIIKESKEHAEAPVWTYPTTWIGMGFDVGFDKVAMRVLTDRNRFFTRYYCSPENKLDNTMYKIREAAYSVLLMALEQRTKAGMKFDSDHLPQSFE